MASQPDPPKEIPIKTTDDISRGHYSNNMIVTHSPEEFMLDWLLNSPSGVQLVSRVIVTPGHLKRIIAALTDNLQKYEQRFGEVKAIEPQDQVFH